MFGYHLRVLFHDPKKTEPKSSRPRHGSQQAKWIRTEQETLQNFVYSDSRVSCLLDSGCCSLLHLLGLLRMCS